MPSYSSADIPNLERLSLCDKVKSGTIERVVNPKIRIASSRLSSEVVQVNTIKIPNAIRKGRLLYGQSNRIVVWIRSQSRTFKPFVSVRVDEIQSKSDPCHWRHIPGEFNVADDVSRGIDAEDLEGRRKSGPDFLYLPESE